MTESKVRVPQKWWWVVAVAVPLAGGALAISPRIIELLRDGGSAPPISGRVVIRDSAVHAGQIVGGDVHEGDETTTQVALTFEAGTPDLSPEDREILERALERLERGDYEGAIPVLRAVAERTPTPSLLNNLAAAHIAIGETAAAQRLMEEARALEAEPALDVRAALNWNERRLAQARTPGSKPIAGIHPARWDGLEVFLTRVEDTGGMVTVEAIYRNAGTERVSFCPHPKNAYVIDERTDESWPAKFASSVNCTTTIEPGASLPIWMKFSFDVADHPRVTVVLHGVSPFDGITPGTGG